MMPTVDLKQTVVLLALASVVEPDAAAPPSLLSADNSCDIAQADNCTIVAHSAFRRGVKERCSSVVQTYIDCVTSDCKDARVHLPTLQDVFEEACYAIGNYEGRIACKKCVLGSTAHDVWAQARKHGDKSELARRKPHQTRPRIRRGKNGGAAANCGPAKEDRCTMEAHTPFSEAVRALVYYW